METGEHAGSTEWKRDRRRRNIFFFKQKAAYDVGVRLVGSEKCIKDSHRASRPEGRKGKRYHIEA